MCSFISLYSIVYINTCTTSAIMLPVSSLYHLVYHSSATKLMTEQDLEQILTKSRAANTDRNVTGILLYSNGDIMQVLEGEREVVLQVYDKIKQDIRHRDVTTLADGQIKARNFSQWSMGFKTVEPNDFVHLAGYLNVSKANYMNGHVETDDLTLHELLSTFVQNDIIRL